MTKHNGKPVPTQSDPKAKTDDALPDAALDKISGGKPQSSITKQYESTGNAIAQNIRG